jgi:hypothetical protein
MGKGKQLASSQLSILTSTNISSNFYIHAKYKTNNSVYTYKTDHYLVYYMTVVPEQGATFIYGNNALINYLKVGSKKETLSIEKDNLKPGKISFNITTKGTITNVTLLSTSGYTL